MPYARPLAPLTIALALILAGCQDDEIRVYEAPKANAASRAATPTLTTTASTRMGWVVPAGWREVPGSQPMRVATFIAGEGEDRLEISVSSFAGAAGGVLANVNRWRGQIGLAAIDEAALAEHLTPLTTVAGRGHLVRLAGSDPQRHVLAAILPEHGGATWFVKATGPAAVLDRHGDALRSFAMSFDPSTTSASTPSSAEPPPTSSAASPAAPASTDRGLPTWEVPAQWTTTTPTSSLVAAAFSVRSGGADAAALVTITPLAGEAGGLLANLNRWRTQVGLPAIGAVAEQPLTTVTVGDAGARIVDLAGPGEGSAPARALIVALLREPGSDRTWYVRLTGPATVVAAERDGFLGFVRSIRFAVDQDAK